MVWIATGVSCSRDELFQPLPESRFDRSVMLTPLICAVENFSVHVVLNLIRCGISPPDRQGDPALPCFHRLIQYLSDIAGRVPIGTIPSQRECHPLARGQTNF